MKRFLVALLSLFLVPSFLFAQNFTQELDATGDAVYGSSETSSGELTTMIGTIIDAVLGILGIILLIMIIYAGFLWMTAGGNPDQVGKAKSFLINAVIGLVIILAAYSISLYVINVLQNAQLAT